MTKLENLLRISPKKNFEDLCSGCTLCESTCHAQHYEGEGKSKSAIKISGENLPHSKGYDINICNQCGTCAKECPETAIYKEGNIYIIDQEKCAGTESCNTCIEACPTDSMFTHPEEKYPIKCDGCGECVDICPLDALEHKIKKPKEARK